MNGPIEATITPTNHDLGDFEVRRALPSKQRRMVGPFIFVDEFGPAHLPSGLFVALQRPCREVRNG